jgi:hypothetical protein
MSHFSRLATRTSTTPNQWLRTCAQIGQVVNAWSGRNDLAVYAGEDSAQGEAIAAFYHSTAEVEINLPQAFGKATTPEMVGDFTERDTQYDWAEPTGVIYHEALHARYSNWDYDYLDKNTDEKVGATFMLLEESRIERKGVLQMPENQLFLRASGLNLALKELDEESVARLSDIRACAHVSALALARVDAGVLKLADVRSTYDKVLEVLGADLFGQLRAIWVEFQSLSVSQIERGIELAKKWNELLKEADPEGEQPSAGEMSQMLQDLMDAMESDAEGTSMSASMDLSDQQTQEEWKQEVSKRSNDTKRKNENKNEATKVFSRNSGAEGTSSRSSLKEQRKPSSHERASAVKIGQMLEKAKYRERSETVVKSHAPAGRLKARVLVQNEALKSKGVRDLAPAWRHKTRKHTDDPTLSIGVMVDISGSMSSAMDAMATTAWVLGEAGRRIQAKTAMVYYGQDVFATLKVGQKLEQVSVWTAPDGTEVFGKAFSALDGALDLTYGTGVRLLVVVSDGHYTGGETERAKQAFRLCAENGVAVLFITPKECGGGGQGKYLVENNGVVLDGLDTNEIALAIGRSASDALAKASV